MKMLCKSMVAAMVLLMGISVTSCSDANEYEDAKTGNPSWSNIHPESLANSKYVRATGIKVNAYGEDVQGYVESLDFISEDSVVVIMSEGAAVDDSNTERLPYYEYNYSNITGTLNILKEEKDEKGNTSKSAIFQGVAISDKQELIAIVHYGDTPAQTYLVKQ